MTYTTATQSVRISVPNNQNDPLTAADQKSSEKHYPDVPIEYRRILELVGNGTHSAVLRSNLGGHPESHVDEWLANMEELALIESVSHKEADLDITAIVTVTATRKQLEPRVKYKDKP